MSKPEKSAADTVRAVVGNKRVDALTKSIMEAPAGKIRARVVAKNAERMRRS